LAAWASARDTGRGGCYAAVADHLAAMMPRPY